MESAYVPNELLAYTFDALKRDRCDDIEEVLMNFYDKGAVRDATKIIWREYVNSLPVWQDRHNTTSTVTRKEVTYIVNGVKLIDEKHSDMDELPVTFVAVRIRNLPSNRFMESMSLSNRVRSLELQMSDFLSTKPS